jgi:hypothetical protein
LLSALAMPRADATPAAQISTGRFAGNAVKAAKAAAREACITNAHGIAKALNEPGGTPYQAASSKLWYISSSWAKCSPR